MKIELRQAKYEDYSYLYELKKRTLKKYISNTWGWDENWQKKYFSTNFNPDLLKIIIKGGNEIGCISIIDEDNQIFLSLIEILPEYQNQGIGSKLIKDLLIKAEKLNTLFIYKYLKQMRKQKSYISVLVSQL